eukprot:gene10645-22225_t
MFLTFFISLWSVSFAVVSNLHQQISHHDIHDLHSNETYGLKLNIVYYAFLNARADWKSYLHDQLSDVSDTGILKHSSLYIYLGADGSGGMVGGGSGNKDTNYNVTLAKEILQDGVKFIREFMDNTSVLQLYIEVTLGNLFEYPGITLLLNLAHHQKHPKSTVFLYFHSKGMVNNNVAAHAYKPFHDVVIARWREALLHFHEDPDLNKAGWVASPRGHMWINFFFVRGSYLLLVDKPPIGDRNLYEHAIGILLPPLDQLQFHAEGVVTHFDTDIVKAVYKNDPHYSGCADTWSMCTKGYQRGISCEGHQGSYCCGYPDIPADKTAN